MIDVKVGQDGIVKKFVVFVVDLLGSGVGCHPRRWSGACTKKRMVVVGLIGMSIFVDIAGRWLRSDMRRLDSVGSAIIVVVVVVVYCRGR